MAEVVNEYVVEKLTSFRSKIAAAEAVMKKLTAAAYAGQAIQFRLDDLTAVSGAFVDVTDFAYDLDEAMTALAFYANENNWTEVPPETQVAKDKGLKARVAFSRINPV